MRLLGLITGLSCLTWSDVLNDESQPVRAPAPAVGVHIVQIGALLAGVGNLELYVGVEAFPHIHLTAVPKIEHAGKKINAQ